MVSSNPTPAYKPTGLRWPGDIPAHWQTRDLKFVAPVSTIKLAEKPAESICFGLEQTESGPGSLFLDTPVEHVACAIGAFRKGDVLFGKLRLIWRKWSGPTLMVSVLVLRSDNYGIAKLLVSSQSRA